VSTDRPLGDQVRRIEERRTARDRVRNVARGATINGTYRLPPGEALDAFRADLLRILGEETS
jgi:hypothetical protein